MTNNQRRYLEEYEKYKNITLEPGLYQNNNGHHIRILRIENEVVYIETVSSGNKKTRTLHWCRKYLQKL